MNDHEHVSCSEWVNVHLPTSPKTTIKWPIELLCRPVKELALHHPNIKKINYHVVVLLTGVP